MRFKSIEIKNYRQYQNIKLEFSPKRTLMNEKSDLHIIIAENGVGKTNILNAITWCLYGQEFHLSDNNSKLPMLNLKTREYDLQEGKQQEKISVIINADNGGKNVTFRRELPWKVNTDMPLVEEFNVIVQGDQGDSDIYEKEQAKEIVEKYMPVGIHQYFYFDGEQLHNYFFGSAGKGEEIQKAIRDISHVGLVYRMNERLNSKIKDIRKEIGSKDSNAKELSDKMEVIDNHILAFKAQIDDVNKQIAQSEDIIGDRSEKLKNTETLKDQELERDKLRGQRTVIESQLKELRAQIKDFAINSKISLELYPYANSVLSMIKEKEKNNELPPDIDKKLLESILSKHMCCVCHQPITSEIEQNIKQLLLRSQISSKTSGTLLSIKGGLENIIQNAKSYKTHRDQWLAKQKAVEHQLREIETDLQILENKLDAISNKEQIRFWIDERKKHESLLNKNREKLGAYKASKLQAEATKEQLKKEYEKSIENQTALERLQYRLKLVEQAQKITDEISSEIMTEIKVQIEERTSTIYKNLLWKDKTYDHIELNENYQLDLYHNEGFSCIGSCSAAEKALLALSFTLALQEISGYNNLLFIDTPVARISGEHRRNFADILGKIGGTKQLVMMFTKDEYSEEISNIFDNAIASQLLLVTDERTTKVG